MRGGTSKGAYFLAEDLPASVAERDELLLRIMGSPDVRQIDRIGGGHPLTSKVAIISRSKREGSQIDFLFAQVSVNEAVVDYKPNCGNILAGVGPFAIERGLIPVSADQTIVQVYTVNTGTRSELIVSTPGSQVQYCGDAAIDGVPGTASAIPVNFLDTQGSVTGSLFASGHRSEVVEGVEVTCIDNGMPIGILRATDVGLTGYESCSEIVGLPGATPNMDVGEVGFDAREVWLGANYPLAATFVEAGKRFGLADLTATGLALAKGLDYQVYSPSSPGKGAFVFNEPNAYYAGEPRITRGPGMSRNLAAWDLLKAAAMASGTSGTSAGGQATGSSGRPR